MNEKDKGPAGTDSVTAATEKDVQSDVTTDVERSIGWHLLHPGFPPNKSEFQALEDSLPAPFISLHDVLERSIAANDSDRQEAARILFTVLGNAGDCPTWYRSIPSTPKSKGKEEPKGSTWGGLLLEHARRTGEPIKFDPAFEYGHDFYETFPSFDSIYAFIRRDGPEIGFQLAEIGPFLTRHGIKGFAERQVVPAEAGSHATPTETDPKSQSGTEDAAPKPVDATPQEPKADTDRAHGSAPSLSDDQKVEIVRRMRTERVSVAQLSRDFSFSRPTIDKVLVAAGLKIKKKGT